MLSRLIQHPLGLALGTLAITVLATAASTTLLWLCVQLVPWWPIPMPFGLKLAMLMTALVTPPFAFGLLYLLRRAERLRAQLARIAAFDELTGVYTRRQFTVLAQAELARRARTGGSAALLAIDADHFKAINDRHGHAAGDAVLRRLGRALRESCARDGLVARYGGEEFLVLLPDAGPAAACREAHALRRRVAGLRVPAPDGGEIAVTVSIGVACASGTGLALGALYRAADAALYRAKHAGRDRVVLAAGPAGARCAQCTDASGCATEAPAGPAAARDPR